MRYSFRSLLVVVGGSAILVAIASQTFVRDVLFPENQYFTADSATELPERFQPYVPERARDIRLRTYQSAWWITAESTCAESEATDWAASINRPLDTRGKIPELPDHSVPAHELAFVQITNQPDRYLWHFGDGGHVSNVVYDRKTRRLYYLQSAN